MSRWVLRVHGSAMVLMGLLMTVVGWAGRYHGSGPMKMFGDAPLAFIGFFQAYLLMASLGAVLWTLSAAPRRAWHFFGLLAHAAPFAANVLFWDDITAFGVPHGGAVFHSVCMAMEGTMLALWGRLGRPDQAAAA